MRARNTSISPEHLESRTLFAAAAVVNGVLRVAGDANAMNAIVVENDATGTNIDVMINSVNSRGVPHSFTRSFPKAGVNAIFVRGGARADNISVGQESAKNTNLSQPELLLPASVLGLGGDHNIITASMNDTIFGGGGNDVIDAGGGDDRVSGGGGNDTITAGNGANIVRGDAGNDTIDGRNGDDMFFGGP